MTILELLSQLTSACRLSGPKNRDSRDCRDKGGLNLHRLFTEWKSGYFEGYYSSFSKFMIENSQILKPVHVRILVGPLVDVF